jgi:hypothetical protein
MDRRLLAVLAVVAAALSTGGVVAQTEEGTVIGNPAVELAIDAGEVRPGETVRLNLTVVNGGRVAVGGPDEFERRVTLARAVEVTVARERLPPQLARGLAFEPERLLLATVPAGDRRSVRLAVTATPGLAPGEYDLPVRVSYDYTGIVRYGPGPPTYVDRSTTRLVRLPVTVARRPQFRLTASQETPIAPGSARVVGFRVRNAGTAPATDIGLSLRTDNVSVTFGGGNRTGDTVESFLERLAPGQNATVAARVHVPAGTPPGTYLVRATAEYRTSEGFEERAGGLRAGVAVANASTGVAGGG